MELADFLPVLIQVVIALAIGVGILVASHIFGARAKPGAIKDSPYECGMLPVGKQHTRFSVKFYVTAMLFILFDIEVVFLVPLTFVYQEFLANSLPILLPVSFFIGLMVLGLVYELRKGAIEWEK